MAAPDVTTMTSPRLAPVTSRYEVDSSHIQLGLPLTRANLRGAFLEHGSTHKRLDPIFNPLRGLGQLPNDPVGGHCQIKFLGRLSLFPFGNFRVQKQVLSGLDRTSKNDEASATTGKF